MKYKVGFLGTGNMGSALATAVYQAEKDIALCDKHEEKLADLQNQLPEATLIAFENREELYRESAFLFLGIKPKGIPTAAGELKDCISEETVLVTMAAGVQLKELCAAAGTDKCIRIMPNTPAGLGQGMILYCCGPAITEAEETEFLRLMSAAGKIDKLDEALFDAASALSGCGPAYVYMFAQALADGAVACGLPRAKATAYAAQTILGSAAMLMESGKHPEQLKDEVCSPGGTTIAGVMELERNHFRSAAAQAVIAAYEKTKRL